MQLGEEAAPRRLGAWHIFTLSTELRPSGWVRRDATGFALPTQRRQE